jgi:hypothetical protein
MYAKITNNQVIQYPANPGLDNPSVSFPAGWGGGPVGINQYVVVVSTQPHVANLGWQFTESIPVQNNGIWEQVWKTELLARDQIKQTVSGKRYSVEVGGVRIANNLYATDRESQTKYVAVALDIQQSNVETWSITWKTNDNQFVSLNAPQMLEVISGVREHVQNCFNKEAEYYQLIDTSTVEELRLVDFSAGWPSNS